MELIIVMIETWLKLLMSEMILITQLLKKLRIRKQQTHPNRLSILVMHWFYVEVHPSIHLLDINISQKGDAP